MRNELKLGSAKDREHAARGGAAFARQYRAKYPKSNKKTTNPIKSTLATMRMRTTVTMGGGSELPVLAGAVPGGAHERQTSARRWPAGLGAAAAPSPASAGATKNDFINRNTTFMTWNLLHLARILEDAGGIPAYGNQRTKWDADCRHVVENPEQPLTGALSVRRSAPVRGPAGPS